MCDVCARLCGCQCVACCHCRLPVDVYVGGCGSVCVGARMSERMGGCGLMRMCALIVLTMPQLCECNGLRLNECVCCGCVYRLVGVGGCVAGVSVSVVSVGMIVHVNRARFPGGCVVLCCCLCVCLCECL